MKRRVLFVLPVFILFASLFLGGYAQAKHKHTPPWAKTIAPIVSTAWLEQNLHRKNLVILDVRSVDDYEDGHVPGSINEPFPNPFMTEWVVSDPVGLWLELPEAEPLFETIGDQGIKRYSRVVIVSDPNPGEPPFYGLANGTRVALTLIYAGVKKVAILDGVTPSGLKKGGI